MSDTPDLTPSSANELSKTSSGSFDANRIGEVKSWLASQFDAAGKDHVPDFEYTPRSISHLHNLATISQAKTQAATIIANDFRLKASEYRSQGCHFFLCIFMLSIYSRSAYQAMFV